MLKIPNIKIGAYSAIIMPILPVVQHLYRDELPINAKKKGYIKNEEIEKIQTFQGEERQRDQNHAIKQH